MPNKHIYQPTTFIRFHNRFSEQSVAFTVNDPSKRNVKNVKAKADVPDGEPYGWPRFVARNWKTWTAHGRVWFHNPFGTVFKADSPSWTNPAGISDDQRMCVDQWTRCNKGGGQMVSGILGSAIGIHDPLHWLDGQNHIDCWGTKGKPSHMPDWGNKTGNSFVDAIRLLTDRGVEVLTYMGSPEQLVVDQETFTTGSGWDPSHYSEYKSRLLTEFAAVLSGGCSIGMDHVLGQDIPTDGPTSGYTSSAQGSHLHRFMKHLTQDIGTNVVIENWPDEDEPAVHFLDKDFSFVSKDTLYGNTAQPTAKNGFDNVVRVGQANPAVNEIFVFPFAIAGDVVYSNIIYSVEETLGHTTSYRQSFDGPEGDLYSLSNITEVVSPDPNSPSGYWENNRRTHNGNVVVGYPGKAELQKRQRRKEVGTPGGVDGNIIPLSGLITESHGQPLIVKGMPTEDTDEIGWKYCSRFINPKLLKRNIHRQLYKPATAELMF